MLWIVSTQLNTIRSIVQSSFFFFSLENLSIFSGCVCFLYQVHRFPYYFLASTSNLMLMIFCLHSDLFSRSFIPICCAQFCHSFNHSVPVSPHFITILFSFILQPTGYYVELCSSFSNLDCNGACFYVGELNFFPKFICINKRYLL